MPRFGMGTWHMGERASARAREVGALRAGLDLGVRLIDTAEMYGDGRAEAIVGDAIAGRRDEVFIVSKCYPHHAGRKSMPAACEASLKRLRIDRLDCYLLHWRGRTPLAETVEAFEALVSQGRIASWGVSNFDVDDMEALLRVPGGERCVTNQVMYNLARREPEWRLLEALRARGMTLMAYSPLDEGSLVRNRALVAIARTLGVTAAQLALAFVLDRDGVVAIPKASDPDHLQQNVDAQAIVLDDATRAQLDAAFPPPGGPARIAIV
jgi:diketogulonate reductase-like aldo/keto reductase